MHFDFSELGTIFQQVLRVLAPGGLALVSFHVGDQVVHVDDLFGAAVSLDFRFHVPSKVIEALRFAHLIVIEHVEREPYEGVEYPKSNLTTLGHYAAFNFSAARSSAAALTSGG